MPSTPERRVAIACQGGGSHTAFTAGVLGRLLSAPDLARYEIVGLSGTSGGAICALLAWAALREGDRAGAGARLEAFWKDNAARRPHDRWLNASVVTAGVLQGLNMYPAISPYALPSRLGGMDAFRALLRRHVDFDRIDVDRAGAHPMLLLGAVDVLTGEFRAFNSREDRITPDAVISSAAIPQLFRAVHTHGGVFWDGLFSQNPPVHDLLATAPDELWVIQINPRRSPTEPRTLTAIHDRRNELSGNLSLHQELGFIETIDQLLEQGHLSAASGYKQIQIRVLEMPRGGVSRKILGPVSKLNREWTFLRGLINQGCDQADTFLTALRFEQAWRAEDLDTVLAALAEDVEIRIEPPFPAWTGGAGAGEDERSTFVRALLEAQVKVDATRKQVAEDAVSWHVRLRAGEPVAHGRPLVTPGVAELTFRDGKVARLRLHPRPSR